VVSTGYIYIYIYFNISEKCKVIRRQVSGWRWQQAQWISFTKMLQMVHFVTLPKRSFISDSHNVWRYTRKSNFIYAL